MDKDKLRHGKETVNIKWDNDIALLAGDAMLALALQKLNSYSENQLLFHNLIGDCGKLIMQRTGLTIKQKQ